MLRTLFHRRNQDRILRPVASAIGEHRLAELLEDRTLLSAISGEIDPTIEYCLADIVEENSAIRNDIEQAKLVDAETADLEPSVESRGPFGDVRLTASLFDGTDEKSADADDVESGDSVTDEPGVEPIDSADAAASSVLCSMDGAGPLTLASTGEFSGHRFAGSVDGSLNGFGTDELTFQNNDSVKMSSSSGSVNVQGMLPLITPGLSDSKTPVLPTDGVGTLNSVPDQPGVIQVARTVDTVASRPTLLVVADAESRIANVDARLIPFESGTPAVENEYQVEFKSVSNETWFTEEVLTTSEAAVTLVSPESAAQNLLASVDPAELSQSISEPLQPILGVAGSMLLMVQTLGRTALAVVFGEGGGDGGPIAEFVEPILEMADIGQPPERWELKTADAALPAPTVQTVTSDRHFEIRNIGPAAAADAEGAVVLTLLTLPRHGVLEHVGVRPNFFRYVPDAGFSGVDEFRYRIKSTTGEVREGQLVINVPAPSTLPGLKTAAREIPLHLSVGQVAQADGHQNGAAFINFDDWRSELD